MNAITYQSNQTKFVFYYLVGETSQVSFDKRTVERIKELELLEESKKQTLFDLIDTYIRDFKTRKAYSV
jgi:hypothetical protein